MHYCMDAWPVEAVSSKEGAGQQVLQIIFILLSSFDESAQKAKKVERQKRQKEYEQAEREGLEPPPKRIPKVRHLFCLPVLEI